MMRTPTQLELPMKFKSGDTVRLRSGGVSMTVTTVVQDYIGVIWMDSLNQIQQLNVVSAALQLLKANDESLPSTT